jgi:hypothetical protein
MASLNRLAMLLRTLLGQCTHLARLGCHIEILPGRKRARGTPLSTRPRADVRAVELVDLLEREPLRLGDEEVHEHEPEAEHPEEDEQDERADVVRDARREEREQEVPQPVCRAVSAQLSDMRTESTYWSRSRGRSPWGARAVGSSRRGTPTASGPRTC